MMFIHVHVYDKPVHVSVYTVHVKVFSIDVVLVVYTCKC